MIAVKGTCAVAFFKTKRVKVLCASDTRLSDREAVRVTEEEGRGELRHGRGVIGKAH